MSLSVCSSTLCNPLTPKHREWSDVLFGDDPNSIQNQIDALVAELACLLILNSAGSTVFTGKDGQNLRLHSLVFGTVHRCLRDSLMRRIRQLSEAKAADPKKDVYSLSSLLDDMQTHAHLLTRANMLCVEGFPYSPPTWEESPHDHVMSTQRNEGIDYVTGARPEFRQPEDRISAAWLERRNNRLKNRSRRVKNFVDKYIAHAATPHSRATIPEADLRVHLALLWTTTSTICKIAHELRVDVLGDSTLVPLPPLRPCETVHASDALAVLDPHRLEEFWGRIVKKLERWYRVRSAGCVLV